MLLPIFFSLSGDHRDLHSFPTRRSSDLGDLAEAFADQRHVWLRRARENAVLFACGLAGTFINPYGVGLQDRKSTRLNSSHSQISYAVFCLKKKKIKTLCLISLIMLFATY